MSVGCWASRLKFIAVYEVMHTGACLPVWGWVSDAAWNRVIDWINDNCDNAESRLIVTPNLGNRLEAPAGLKAIADGAARQNAQGNSRGPSWAPGDGLIVIVWPQERTVQRCVQMVAGLPEPSIILWEQAVTDDARGYGNRSALATTFQGWASAVGAFNAADDQSEPIRTDLEEQLDDILTNYENELALAPTSASSAYPNSAPILREKLQAVRAGGYDEDFVVTYAIALGYPHDLKKLRRHYSAAGS